MRGEEGIHLNAGEIVKKLGLKPLPVEGGFFREYYRSPVSISADALNKEYNGPRPLMTSIYYLLTAETCSRMHRLPSDEIWHHYMGGAVRMLVLHPGGRADSPVLGPDIANGQRPQILVPKGCWQGAALEDEDGFALMGTTVSPGFEFSDFETGKRSELARGWPEREELIKRLTPDFVIPLS
jgi:predicted cupin superfamily sugar epimerase